MAFIGTCSAYNFMPLVLHASLASPPE